MYRQKIIATILFFLFQLAVTTAKPVTNALNGRETIPFNANWQFYFAYNFEQGIKKETVNLPHTWNANEVLEGVAEYKRSAAIYENSLNVLKEWGAKRLFLYFEGANSVATVFVNNKAVAEHKGGYTGFAVEITDYVKPGNNSIAVQVSNAYRLDVIPLHGDFNIYGGLHRPVSLILTEKNCISPLDYGSSGVYLTQKAVSENSADLEILTKLSLSDAKNLSLKTTLFDQTGKEIRSITHPVNTGAGAGRTTQIKTQMRIQSPHLWNGKADPYLYSVAVDLLEDGKVTDHISQPLGFRYYSVDPDKGFFLNGKYLDLYGAGRHEDWSGKGSALTDADHDQDMELMKEMGATAARLTHYPHSKHFYDLCDQNGMVLWSEIPFVGPGGYTGTGYVKDPQLEENTKKMLKELIRQNYNHPSVCFWGLFNELKLNYDDPQPFIKELNELAKAEDPGRLTTLASNLGPANFTDLTDLMGWNQYFGWYGGSFDQVAKWADQTHQALPGKPISISEYGAGASPFKHIEELTAPEAKGRFHPEEWQTAFHEKHWEELKKRPYIWGKFIWVLADFGSGIRTEGDNNGINDKGLVTYDRKIKKDAFYFYKANWNPEPMVYITSRRNTMRTKAVTPVKIFSNLPDAELWINGKSMGKKKKNAMNTMIWENVKLNKGKNEVLVKGKSAGSTLADTCIWELQ
ncbi:glycoside hydrolase family 2 protein [Pedobacter sp. N36a]|uniref:glycoside hydrolase family 2 protein n=1 Tax=Pedobacter sp. N36a TaxID=2767996 RepID=UPI00165708BF|nr:glycoside hydrolase family 2 TIM barrel-domain containing protein [Pedobacter sp. N36a]MBC8987313.1 glycoside hydrolase family 2 protein [Pedobacter sp. N36a]